MTFPPRPLAMLAFVLLLLLGWTLVSRAGFAGAKGHTHNATRSVRPATVGVVSIMDHGIMRGRQSSLQARIQDVERCGYSVDIWNRDASMVPSSQPAYLRALIHQELAKPAEHRKEWLMCVPPTRSLSLCSATSPSLTGV